MWGCHRRHFTCLGAVLFASVSAPLYSCSWLLAIFSAGPQWEGFLPTGQLPAEDEVADLVQGCGHAVGDFLSKLDPTSDTNVAFLDWIGPQHSLAENPQSNAAVTPLAGWHTHKTYNKRTLTYNITRPKRLNYTKNKQRVNTPTYMVHAGKTPTKPTATIFNFFICTG